MPTFSNRLQVCMVRGDMTVSDLGHWFERPRATVNTWVDGRTPWGPSGRAALLKLERLEWAIRNKQGFPVPEELSGVKRPVYIRGIKYAVECNHRVPQVRASG